MESERDQAKAAIGETGELDLSGPVDAATRLRLVSENNKHLRRMSAGERGLLGYLLGGKDNAPVIIAFLVTVAGIGLGAWCLARAANGNGGTGDFWSKQFERCFALAGTALGFIFGSKTSSK